MPDETVKQKYRRAKQRAEKILISSNYILINPEANHLFTVIGTRNKEVRMVRIVLNKPSDDDVRDVASFPCPNQVTKEIWSWLEGGCFDVKEVN